jgi:hypothetical protein
MTVLKFIGFMALVAMIAVVAWLIFMFITFGSSDSKNDVLQHSFISSDSKITALVIRDDCGATCSCKMRVDLKSDSQYLKEIFRDTEACDAVITWLDAEHLKIETDFGKQVLIDINTLGLKI